MEFDKIGVVADDSKVAQDALASLTQQYDLIQLDPEQPDGEDVDVIVALGGDGFMLHTLHSFIDQEVPFYGMNCGTVGFLMNEYQEEDLLERIRASVVTLIHPLKMTAESKDGSTHECSAINEVSLLRKSKQAANLRMLIDGHVRMEEMVCDGVLVSTPAGSSAYNASVGGPIIPIRTWLLALTPISPFRPRRWRGALIPDKAKIRIEVLDADKRPVNAVADFSEVEDIVAVDIQRDDSKDINLLFDDGHSLEERILTEQFTA